MHCMRVQDKVQLTLKRGQLTLYRDSELFITLKRIQKQIKLACGETLGANTKQNKVYDYTIILVVTLIQLLIVLYNYKKK